MRHLLILWFVAMSAGIHGALAADSIAAITGRVVDSNGKEVVGARVQLWTQHRHGDGFVFEASRLPAVADALTNAEGRFQIVAKCSRHSEYAVGVLHHDYLPGMGPWFTPADAAGLKVPELSLRRLRTLRGWVVDRQHRPLSEARVFQSGDGIERTETQTGDDGSFALLGVAEGTAFVFAEVSGFRFAGQAVAQSGATEIVLAGRDEPGDPQWPSSEPTTARADEQALARRVVRPFVERALTGSRSERYSALRDWARLDPGDALERIDGGAIADMTDAEVGALQTWAMRPLLRDDFDEAAAVVESIDNIHRRLEATILLAVRAPIAREGKREMLEQAVLQTARVDEPGSRASWLACVADALLDLQYKERARSLLAKARTFAATSPMAGSAGSPRRRVATVLARIDLAPALALVGELGEDRQRDDVFGQIAYRIAENLPADAQRLLARVDDDTARQTWTERVCWRMAPADPKRAYELSSQLADRCHQALALGWMAGAIAASDKPEARLWLERAFTDLNAVAAENETASGARSAAVTAALLLPIAETIDANLARECFWRAVSFRHCHSGDNEQEVLAETAVVAFLLSRYDRATARQLLKPVVELVERHAVSEMSRCGGITVAAMCAIDPRWAAEFVNQSSEAARFGYWGDWCPWSVFAWILGTPPENRTRLFLRDFLDGQYWLPGGPDNPFHARF